MSKKIYVGNLPYSATEDEIRQLFASYGQVDSVSLVTDRETGRPRGFGFVEMSSGAAEAIQALDQSAMGGRTLNVNEARPREPAWRWRWRLPWRWRRWRRSSSAAQLLVSLPLRKSLTLGRNICRNERAAGHQRPFLYLF